ncbi:TetR family transcriptional regulator [Sphingomonas metalli]|uniref:TetR family transcriptional regulator n=1 Tax=Sphingomonas metalli TaxID=1779358 RepID=A0A916T2P7_9SPHN|nr:TetR/AcrR family transcriptional regulator [Sphingomonas metalli]GGB29183.1 TetR family transcriptional regulator [Sphingomonas metalli]
MPPEIADPCATRREQRKQDRRQAIVDAAKISFLEDGYAATSMSGLLKTLGGSKATLWSYFRSKEELFAAVIADLTQASRLEMAEALSTATELEPALTAYCRSLMRKLNNPDSIATYRLVVGESGRFPEVGRIFYQQAVEPTRARLAAFLADHIAAGWLRDSGPAHMAEVLSNMSAGPHTRLLWNNRTMTAAEMDENATRVARCFLRAFAPDPSQGGPLRNFQPVG